MADDGMGGGAPPAGPGAPHEAPNDFDPEEFLRPAMTASLPGVYFIGPYGRRVSFASQQRRALNTVWALVATDRLAPGARVGVIGAGLAGVTAATALGARGMRVFLYEEKANALNLQIQTTHRFVHPSINFWPKEKLRPSTRFPFFDWAAGVCDDIVRDVHDEWVKVREILKEAQALQRFFNNMEVKSLTAEGGKVKVKPRKTQEPSAEYDVVIVTAGFGEEDIEPNTNTVSYWRQDPVEAQVRDSDLLRFLVSGTGDGGLIDTLRLLHRDFDTGRFCVRIAQELTDAGAADALKRVEDSVHDLFDTTYAAVLADDPDATQEAMAVAGAAAAEAYAEQLETYVRRDLPDDVAEDLRKSLIQEPGRQVSLVGRLPRPYSMNAAPIHRLMIAHAFHRGALVYRRGSLKAVGLELTVVSGVEATVVNPEYSIARHGSVLPIERFIPDADERRDLQTRQEAAATWLDDTVVPMGYFNFKDYPPHDPTDPKFILSRHDRAEAYMKPFGAYVHPCTGKVPRFEISPRPGRTVDQDDIPDELFGVPVLEAHARRKFGSAAKKVTRGG